MKRFKKSNVNILPSLSFRGRIKVCELLNTYWAHSMEKYSTVSESSTYSNEYFLTSVLCTDFSHCDSKLRLRILICGRPEDDVTHFNSSERAASEAAERASQNIGAVRATPSAVDLVVDLKKGTEDI